MKTRRSAPQRILLASAWLLVAALVAPAAASTRTTVIDLSLAGGGTQRILDVRPDAPVATVIGLPGGFGILGIGSDGSVAVACYPFYRIRNALASQGIAVVLVDAASDGSVYGFENVSSVIRWAREQADLPVWVSGGSSSASPAASIINGQPAAERVGALFFSPDRPVRAAVGHVTRPSLVVYNQADANQFAESFYAALSAAPVKQLVGLSGTSDGGCRAHTFEGLDQSLADTIAAFIHEHNGATGPTRPFDPNQAGLTGSWANAATDGQGLLLDVTADFYVPGRALLFGGWFTYDVAAGGGPRWYTVQGELAGSGGSSMAIYQTLGGRLDSAQATRTSPVGTFTIQFADCGHANARYQFDDGRSGAIPLRRLLDNVTCREDAGTPPAAENSAWSGAWADPANSGQGLVLEFNPTQQLMFGAWYTFRADAPAGAGADAQVWYTLQAGAPRGANALQDIGLYATQGGVFDRHATVSTTRVGTAELGLHDCTMASLAYRFTAGPRAGSSGTLDLLRLTPPVPGCQLWP